MATALDDEWPILFTSHFCAGQTRCMNQLKNPQRFISLDNRPFCAAEGCRPRYGRRKVTSASNIVVGAFRFAERVNVFVKQRQFRCEVHVAKKPYTQGSALLRQPQELFG
ncbi:hypothetical protein ACFFYR_23590 [Paraburkholderia dipogonis]|uniref:hypothetical protein n=1 Tax=Paraburkholderia dipogonis TaxID=1211383 RepID=UPI0035E6973B